MFLILFMAYLSSGLEHSCLYNYIEGDDHYQIQWQVQQLSENKFFVQSTSSKYVLGHTVICDTSCETSSWEYINENAGSCYRGVKRGDSVMFTGTLAGEAFEKSVVLKDLPWFQFLGFSLAWFATSDQDWIKFNCIRPEDLKAYVMLAKKKGTETIELNRETIKVIHIRVSLTGLLAYLGGVHFWFREDDGVFVKFEGLGLPWTSRIIYELTSSTIS